MSSYTSVILTSLIVQLVIGGGKDPLDESLKKMNASKNLQIQENTGDDEHRFRENQFRLLNKWDCVTSDMVHG